MFPVFLNFHFYKFPLNLNIHTAKYFTPKITFPSTVTLNSHFFNFLDVFPQNLDPVQIYLRCVFYPFNKTPKILPGFVYFCLQKRFFLMGKIDFLHFFMNEKNLPWLSLLPDSLLPLSFKASLEAFSSSL